MSRFRIPFEPPVRFTGRSRLIGRFRTISAKASVTIAR
jgi:hypothetical protein